MGSGRRKARPRRKRGEPVERPTDRRARRSRLGSRQKVNLESTGSDEQSEGCETESAKELAAFIKRIKSHGRDNE